MKLTHFEFCYLTSHIISTRRMRSGIYRAGLTTESWRGPEITNHCVWHVKLCKAV